MIAGTKYDTLENINELIDAIEMGLDIEFYIDETRYNISTNTRPFIAVCPNGDAEYYNTGNDLVEKHNIAGQPLINQWGKMKIIGM